MVLYLTMFFKNLDRKCTGVNGKGRQLTWSLNQTRQSFDQLLQEKLLPICTLVHTFWSWSWAQSEGSPVVC